MKSNAFLPLLILAFSFNFASSDANTKTYLRDVSLKTPEQVNVSIAESKDTMNVTFTTVSTE